MKGTTIVAAVVLALGLSAGCSEPTAETPSSGSDAGTDDNDGSNNNGGSNNNNNNNNNNNSGGMRINALDINVASPPILGMSGTAWGVIILKAGSEDVTDAVVTVNDVPLTYNSDEYGYALSDATFENLGAGSTIAVKATRGSETVSVSFDCPADVTFTPASGTAVGEGETVTFGWTGNITYENPVGKPNAAVIPYDTASKAFGITPPTARKDDITGTSADLIVPVLPGGFDAYVAELTVAGAHAKNGDSEGYCRYVKRNQLAVK